MGGKVGELGAMIGVRVERGEREAMWCGGDGGDWDMISEENDE